MMYKVKHKLLSSYVVNIFEENETRYQLRNEKRLYDTEFSI